MCLKNEVYKTLSRATILMNKYLFKRWIKFSLISWTYYSTFLINLLNSLELVIFFYREVVQNAIFSVQVKITF